MWVIRGSLLLGMVFLWGGDLIIDSPEQINQQWEEKFLGIKYGITTLDNAVSEMVDGLIDPYFNKEFIGRINQAIKNQPKGEGEYKEYWSNGTLKTRLPYKDGKAHGHLHGWYENGGDAFKGYFTDGVKQGIHMTFFHTEPKNIQTIARKLTFDERGVLDGEISREYPNNQLLLYINYLKGKASGKLTGWREKGGCLLEVLYKDGVLQKGPVPNPGQGGERRAAPYLKYANEVVREFEKITYKEFGLQGFGGGGEMPFDVVNFGVDFSIIKRGTIEEGRELIVKLKQKLVETVNAHEKIRPYLREYPFPLKGAYVNIFFRSEDGSASKDGSIANVLLNLKDELCYGIATRGFATETVLIEPYEEAVKIVHAKDLKK